MKNIFKTPSYQTFRCFRIILGMALLLMHFLSCNDEAVYDMEQYKNTFALISESDNVARKFHQLGEESIGYIAASMGGTKPTQNDISIELVEDNNLIDQFNRTNYDTDVSKYVKPMPKDKYDIEKLQFKILAGEIGGRLPIKIRPDGLSPDSSYFIPLRIESFSSYEANKDKSFILYRIKTKNYYALSDATTIYNMRGKYRQQGSPSELEMPGSKIMHPITKNSVRIMAGNEAYVSDVNEFNKFAIVLSVAEDNRVTISPYKNIEVTQINGDSDFPNIFKIEDDGFKTYKTFLLRYNYVSDGVVIEMKEELRLEFNEDDEVEN
ncbi:MAG: BT_3044 domain-containing protein [Sphingobacterium sp.]